MSEREPRVVSFLGCARCDGAGHDDLLFQPLDRPIELPQGPAGWWAPCPTNGQPILLVEWENGPSEAVSLVGVTVTKLDEEKAS